MRNRSIFSEMTLEELKDYLKEIEFELKHHFEGNTVELYTTKGVQFKYSNPFTPVSLYHGDLEEYDDFGVKIYKCSFSVVIKGLGDYYLVYEHDLFSKDKKSIRFSVTSDYCVCV